MVDQTLTYGDGVIWSGRATGVLVTIHFKVEFSNATQEIPFQVTFGQGSLSTANSLMTHWNDNWPDEAFMPKPGAACVQFHKPGQKVKRMQVKEDNGAWLDLPAAVNGFTVTNVLTCC